MGRCDCFIEFEMNKVLRAELDVAHQEIRALNREAEQQEETIVSLKNRMEYQAKHTPMPPTVFLPSSTPCHCEFSFSAGVRQVKVDGCPIKDIKDKAEWAKSILEDIAK